MWMRRKCVCSKVFRALGTIDLLKKLDVLRVRLHWQLGGQINHQPGSSKQLESLMHKAGLFCAFSFHRQSSGYLSKAFFWGFWKCVKFEDCGMVVVLRAEDTFWSICSCSECRLFYLLTQHNGRVTASWVVWAPVVLRLCKHLWSFSSGSDTSIVAKEARTTKSSQTNSLTNFSEIYTSDPRWWRIPIKNPEKMIIRFSSGPRSDYGLYSGRGFPGNKRFFTCGTLQNK